MAEREGVEKPSAAPSSAATPQATAAYVAELTTELAGLARAARLDFLANLLDMTQLEAAATAKRLAGRTRG